MKTFWVNVYLDNCYQSRDSADNCHAIAGDDRIALIKVEYEIGQFDSSPDEYATRMLKQKIIDKFGNESREEKFARLSMSY